MNTPREVVEHYNAGQEVMRLKNDFGWLERVRTEDILRRYLPASPSVVFDIGGAAGIYALPLAEQGNEVHLLDPVRLHVEQAKRASEEQEGRGAKGIASTRVGDARQLPYANESASAVLLLGPLYHLTEKQDRLRALREAHRVLQKGGVVIAAAISRFASLMDGLSRGLIKDPQFHKLLEKDLKDGQHRNESADPRYFTTAFFHRPEELKDEVAMAGFHPSALIGVEGPVWNPLDLSYWTMPENQTKLLDLLRSIESEPSLLGASAHLVAVGRK